MITFKNTQTILKKQVIDNHMFIKEETRDKLFGLINVEVYLKTTNEYKMINKSELPNRYIISLSKGKNEEYLSFMEITEFNKYKNELVNKIKEENELDNRVCQLFGSIYEVNRDTNFFTIHMDEVNEFYKVKMKEFNTLLIPYMICNLIETNKNYNNQLFLINTNFFVQISDNKVCTLIQVNDKTGECQIRGIYLIKKENGEYVIEVNIDKEKIEKIVRKETERFIKKLETA